MRFRKKPVEIEAVTVSSIIDAILGDRQAVIPPWVWRAIEGQVVEVHSTFIWVETLEGRMRGDEKDWLIKGTRNELYPIKPEPFDDTFDPIEED